MLLKEKVEEVRKKIKTKRLDKEYTQDYIGGKLGISQIAYHKIENGKSQLKVEILFRLAIVLEVDVVYFLKIE